MPAQLNKNYEFEENNSYLEQEPKYQDFQEINFESTKLQELFFFARVAIFSLVSVFFAFVLLAINFAAVWAFLFSSLMSFGITILISKSVHSFLS